MSFLSYLGCFSFWIFPLFFSRYILFFWFYLCSFHMFLLFFLALLLPSMSFLPPFLIISVFLVGSTFNPFICTLLFIQSRSHLCNSILLLQGNSSINSILQFSTPYTSKIAWALLCTSFPLLVHWLYIHSCLASLWLSASQVEPS